MAPSKNAQALPYAKDEKVLCFHGDLMYEAKIIEIRQGASGSGGNAKDGKSANGDRHRGGGGGGGDHGNEVKYLVHYKGWKSSWDDWVTADRIRKFDDENKILASTLGGGLSAWNQPIEVIRVEMQSKKVDPNRPKKMTVGNTARYIYETNGLRGLYRGVAPRIGLGVWQTVCMVALGDM